MGCCGSTQKVRKIVIPPEYKPVGETKPQVRQDDVIRVPKDKRKLFRVAFDLKQIFPPEYLIVQSLDYSTQCTHIEILPEMMREQSVPIQMNRTEDLNKNEEKIKPEQKSFNQSQANNKHEESTQANRIAQRQVHVEIIDVIN